MGDNAAFKTNDLLAVITSCSLTSISQPETRTDSPTDRLVSYDGRPICQMFEAAAGRRMVNTVRRRPFDAHPRRSLRPFDCPSLFPPPPGVAARCPALAPIKVCTCVQHLTT